ncbi:MAG: hypothetical protein AAF626_00975 [Pseudomonadota bacterium]
MIRKSISALMGAAALVASVSAASAGNTVSIFDSNVGFVTKTVPGFSHSGPKPSLHFLPRSVGTPHVNWFKPPRALPPVFGTRPHVAFPYAVTPYNDYVVKIPTIRPVIRPVFKPVTKEVVIAPLITPVLAPEVVKLSFDCIVAGTPVVFPNDIYISNPYDFTTTDGVKVAYAAPGGSEGTVTLPAIEPGEGIYVSNAVKGGMTPGTTCSAMEE